MRRLTGLVANDSSRQFLLAVSGGADSMCLAELFLGSSLGLKFAVAHCNFTLRGKESDGDEAFVRAWAEEHGVRFYSKRFETETYAKEKGISIEMAARDLRYSWFNEICLKDGYEAVCVAHNLNDNAETLVLNLLRGTGSRGICGMAPKSAVPVAGGVTLLRPMLEFSRKEIVAFLETGHREDCTNADCEYKRNKVRNQIFPLFEEINPSFLRTIGR
ncbi:MAG: tRNA lysidine(34) synthetase TilS, partial [Bacteroidales bacterium]|nr:tRNA lysidine(34) synthetase TilS [Bacteroidales bacterium]